MKSENIDIRIRALKFNLEKLNEAYSDLKRDAFADVGLDTKSSYPDTEETRALLRKPEQLMKERQDVLFFTIFNFTQTYYSIKEYLRKEFPSKEKDIKNFYYHKPLKFKKREELSNDLKHNPANDLKFEFRQTDARLLRNNKGFTLSSSFKESWFYDGIETVEYCNSLYRDLIIFLENGIDYTQN